MPNQHESTFYVTLHSEKLCFNAALCSHRSDRSHSRGDKEEQFMRDGARVRQVIVHCSDQKRVKVD